jgi:uncharacterized protein (DUF1501 family)
VVTAAAAAAAAVRIQMRKLSMLSACDVWTVGWWQAVYVQAGIKLRERPVVTAAAAAAAAAAVRIQMRKLSMLSACDVWTVGWWQAVYVQAGIKLRERPAATAAAAATRKACLSSLECLEVAAAAAVTNQLMPWIGDEGWWQAVNVQACNKAGPATIAT